MDASAARQLACFSEVTSFAKSISEQLCAEGLGLLRSEIGGRVGPEQREVASLKQELLRERFGRWHVRRGVDDWQSVGYESELIADVKSGLAITSEQLLGTDRSPSVERIIAGQPWGGAFSQDHLSWLSSMELMERISDETRREVASLGICPVVIPNTQGVRSLFLHMLRDLGYHKAGRSVQGGVVVERKESPRLQVRLSHSVLSGHTSTVSVSARPILNLSGASADLRSGFERGNYFAILEPFVEGFERYRGATGEGEFALQLYAYQKFFAAVLPLMEAGTADCVSM